VRGALEEARGELGLTRSQLELMSRELQATRRQLAEAQKQLEQARFERSAGGGGGHFGDAEDVDGVLIGASRVGGGRGGSDDDFGYWE
jgi:hypothetical protein